MSRSSAVAALYGALLHGVLLYGISPPALAQADSDSWKTRYREATRHTHACFGEKTDAGCRALIAGYEQAMAATDADAAVRHTLFRELLHAEAVYGGNLRQRGQLDDAASVLDDAYDQMVEHYDNGKHFHTLIENLRLQGELAQVEILLGRTDADTLVGHAREAADLLYRDIDADKDDAHAMTLQHANLVASDDLETGVASAYALRAESLAGQGRNDEVAKLRAAGSAAYDCAALWIERASLAGVQGAMDVNPMLRISEVKREAGDLQLARGDRAAATQAYLQAGAYSCGALEPDTGARLQAGQDVDPEQQLLHTECLRASSGYLRVSGALARQVEGMADAMYREQMAQLDIDITPLLRATQEQQP